MDAAPKSGECTGAPSKMEECRSQRRKGYRALSISRSFFIRLVGGALTSVAMGLAAATAPAAQLTVDARSAIPHDAQQIIVIDYDAMLNSQTAMDLKDRLMPPELKQLERALTSAGMDDNNDIDELAFASFKPAQGTDQTKTIGIAQGQFSVADILAGFHKKKLKPQVLRNNRMWPMSNGMLVCFVNPTTMVFGSSDAMKYALNARDGFAANVLSNPQMMQDMGLVDQQPLWSVLDAKGTQQMMNGILGQASQLGDYSQVKKMMQSSRYSMDFSNGVRFNLSVVTGDTVAAATMASLMNAAAMYEKMSASPTEKQAIDNTQIGSSSGTLNVNYSSTDDAFTTLLHSSLFQSVVH